MKTLLRYIFALIALMGIAASPALASADGGDTTCDTLEECQEMVAQYEALYGPLPEPTPTPPAAPAPNIPMTGGDRGLPPQEIAYRLQGYESDLFQIATFVCNDETYQRDIITSETTIGRTPAETFASFETWVWTEDGLVWATVYGEYSTYLQQLADEGYDVKSRPPTLHELVLQFPGCETGEYENPGK